MQSDLNKTHTNKYNNLIHRIICKPYTKFTNDSIKMYQNQIKIPHIALKKFNQKKNMKLHQKNPNIEN